MTAALPSLSLPSRCTPECVIVSPMKLDELDENGKIRNIAKIRNSISRNVSFIKRSLVRRSSMNGGSNRSIISLDETSVTKDDFSEETFIDSLNPLRSCMKGNRRKTNQQFVVRFQKRSKYDICTIESYFKYAADLWYTTSNEKALFLSPQLDTVSETMQAEQYMTAYTFARKEVYPKEWFQMKEPLTMKSSYTQLLASSYDDIVQGRQYGFAGLEQFSNSHQKRRTIHVQSIVLMICAAYCDFKNNTIDSLHSNNKLQDKINPDGTLSYNAISELMRKYSKSLTECDRYWATAMGQADYHAAVDSNDKS